MDTGYQSDDVVDRHGWMRPGPRKEPDDSLTGEAARLTTTVYGGAADYQDDDLCISSEGEETMSSKYFRADEVDEAPPEFAPSTAAAAASSSTDAGAGAHPSAARAESP